MKGKRGIKSLRGVQSWWFGVCEEHFLFKLTLSLEKVDFGNSILGKQN